MASVFLAPMLSTSVRDLSRVCLCQQTGCREQVAYWGRLSQDARGSYSSGYGCQISLMGRAGTVNPEEIGDQPPFISSCLRQLGNARHNDEPYADRQAVPHGACLLHTRVDMAWKDNDPVPRHRMSHAATLPNIAAISPCRAFCQNHRGHRSASAGFARLSPEKLTLLI